MKKSSLEFILSVNKFLDYIIIFNSEALQLENTRPTHDLILIEIIQTMFFEVFK